LAHSECGGITSSEIRSEIATKIAAKNELLPRYRANLPTGARAGLLLFSVTVARSFLIPLGIGDWKFPFEFDRVFWFACFGDEVVEIQRAESAQEILAQNNETQSKANF
jgi:hypothetical protein